MAKSFLRYEVNDGNTARFWTDIWYPRGRLIEVAGEISTQRLGIRREARISEVFREGLWHFRRCRDPNLLSLIVDIKAFNICLTDGRDAVLWKRRDGNYGSRFVASETWHQIRQSKNKVNWSKLVWFSRVNDLVPHRKYHIVTVPHNLLTST